MMSKMQSSFLLNFSRVFFFSLEEGRCLPKHSPADNKMGFFFFGSRLGGWITRRRAPLLIFVNSCVYKSDDAALPTVIPAADKSPSQLRCVSRDRGMPSYARHVSTDSGNRFKTAQLSSFKLKFRAYCSAESLKICFDCTGSSPWLMCVPV